jgi:RNA polymerase sigma factor (sigma-70 family)
MVWEAREYDALYRRYAPMVQRRARALLGSDTEALDVVQDLFASLFERPAQFAGKSQLSTFLYAATTHACWARLRKHRVRTRLMERHGPGGLELRADARSEQLAMLREELGRLDEELAQVVVYYYLDEMTHAEIAEILGCSRRQVGYLLERVSAKIRVRGEGAL